MMYILIVYINKFHHNNFKKIERIFFEFQYNMSLLFFSLFLFLFFSF